MTVDSQFNIKTIRKELGAFVLAAAGLGGVFHNFSDAVEMLTALIFILGLMALAAIFWLSRLKRVAVWNDGIEVSSLLWPFSKREYRFAEFDYVVIKNEGTDSERMVFVRNLRRDFTLRAAWYLNYQELKQAIRIPLKEKAAAYTSREIKSAFFWWTPLIFIGVLFLVLIGLAVPLAVYLDTGSVDAETIYLGIGIALGFAIFGGIALYPYKRLTVWQGRIDARRLIWPFVVKHYRMDDFDGCYEVTENKRRNDAGSGDEAHWLMRNGQLSLRICGWMYVNYEELKTATQTRVLNSMEAGAMEQLQAWRGKVYY